ncbi:ribosome-associated heat shock protein Hsp15 [Aliidiomarina quisquiliarum]|uniref:ribosome-associated heat shock protein Hsp15 n=1 Tax=Aliidiomarina quisquiliarum TaxID=2938947 RepID=UPI00208F043B|nr:ribosome-associated heat shock protein Hsp15 [Aliidiomarina quisquiliarum]MCO4321572.1 ribosome-associated heat shock protein Hsp15 [Aliidiomarina quisquiliarum]
MSQQSSLAPQVRLDKWLWAARFFKTRGLARTAVQAGKVQYNGQRTKPAKIVELDAIIIVPRGYDRMTVTVTGLSEQRGNATKAAELYQESAASLAKREENAAARKANALYNPHPEQRPNSKQRRELIKFKNQ